MMNKENAWIPTEKNIEDYELLKDMLDSLKKEFDLLSNKKADGQLNTMKIKMVNRVLEPLKELFLHEPSHTFLDTLDQDEIPSNSDVVLIIGQYKSAILNFRNRYHDNFHWITVEREENMKKYEND